MERPCYVNEKLHTLKNKTACRLVKSIISELKIKNTMFSIKEDFVIVPTDKTSNNVALICKHLYAFRDYFRNGGQHLKDTKKDTFPLQKS